MCNQKKSAFSHRYTHLKIGEIESDCTLNLKVCFIYRDSLFKDFHRAEILEINLKKLTIFLNEKSSKKFSKKKTVLKPFYYWITVCDQMRIEFTISPVESSIE